MTFFDFHHLNKHLASSSSFYLVARCFSKNDFFKKHEITLARRLPHPAELESPTGAGSDLMIKGLVEVLLAEMLEKNAGKTAKKQQDKVED